LRLFELPDAEKRKLWRRKFDAARPNIYRGWFPLQNGALTYKEGIDIGPDIAHADLHVAPDDPLTEATPLPLEQALPGWRTAARGYYQGMEHLGATMMRAMARGLGLSETTFDDAFRGGISTLRLIRYPVRPETSFAGADQDKVWLEHKGQRWYTVGGAHVDSGFVTLLAQDGVEDCRPVRMTGAGLTFRHRGHARGQLRRAARTLDWRPHQGDRASCDRPGRERCSIPFFL